MTKLQQLLQNSFSGLAVPNYAGLLLRNQWKFLMGWGLTLARVLLGFLTPLHVIGIYRFARQCARLARRNGVRFLVLRLKAEQMLLMQVAGGHPNVSPLDGRRIRRSKKGYPSVIPPKHRERIHNGDAKVASFWMSLFGLYRVIEFPGVAKVSTITDPGVDISGIIPEFLESIEVSLYALHSYWGLPKGLIPSSMSTMKTRSTSKEVGFYYGVKDLLVTFFPIFKSSPSPWTRELPEGVYYPKGQKPEVSHGWYSLIASSKALLSLPVKEAFAKYALGTGNGWYWLIVEFFSTYQYPPQSPTDLVGRLAPLAEPAGKVRIIAMLDPFTQWLLYPLHAALFRLFERIPTDGTHDQYKALTNLISWAKERKVKTFYSFDLTAATDRLPVEIQAKLLNFLLGGNLGNAWKDLLVGRKYAVSHFLPGVEPLTYAVGQPMGAYSSWAMLNITHHLIVQWAYHRACLTHEWLEGHGPWFMGYAVLGDDIVIANSIVADQYLQIMKILGVGVNTSKSLISNNGSAEFAKRFILRYQDASPLSWKEIAVATKSIMVALELLRKLSSFREVGMKSLFDIYQRGYLAKSRMNSAISGMSATVGGLVLSWLISKGLTIESMFRTSVGNPTLVLDNLDALRIHFFGSVQSSIVAFYQRVGIFSYEKNFLERIGETLKVPKKNTPIGRFIFRSRWAAAIFGNYYRLAGEGLTVVAKVKYLLEELQRKALRTVGQISPFTNEELQRLLELQEIVDDIRGRLPANLRCRPVDRPFKLWPKSTLLAYRMRRKTHKYVAGKRR